jgi:5-methylcytosine-specific restriction protein A
MLRPCSVPTCPGVALRRGRCVLHARVYEQARGTHSQRGYPYAWGKIRAAFLAMNPSCVVCGAHATEADHLTPKAQGGTDHPENLRAVCRSCHSRRTAADVWPRKPR